jgi:alpha/beta superfamily hydrolase
MQITEKLFSPGEHPLFLQGVSGPLEAVLTVPNQSHPDFIAFLGHPHSLQGGTMNNKVVTTLVRAFKEMNIISLRFNFRGVGQSPGTYDAGIGESEDMLALVREWQKVRPQAKLIFAGFSFGSYVTYRVAAQVESKLLISVAPAVHHYNYNEYHPAPHPWMIVQGEEDEVVPAHLVFDFAAQANPQIPIIPFANTGHFFHGKLMELKAQLIDWIKSQVVL